MTNNVNARCWVVTCYSSTGRSEPIVTVFNNEEAAKKCYDYFTCSMSLSYWKICIDRCEVYNEFQSG